MALTFLPLRAGADPMSFDAAAPPQDGLSKTAQNLLVHIPGEAIGFYIMAVDALENPSHGTIILLAVLSFVLLVLVRWVAKASKGVWISTIAAFLVWMCAMEKGVFHVLMPDLCQPPVGIILAGFLSAVITILANQGGLTSRP